MLNPEKHLRAHRDITAGRIQAELLSLKRMTALKLLAELRASNPTPPMVSLLDISDADEDPEEGVSGLCRNQTCMNARVRVRELERKLDAATRLNADLTRQLRELKKAALGRQGPSLGQLLAQPPASSSSSGSEEEEEEEQQPPQQRPAALLHPQTDSSSGTEEGEEEEEEEQQQQQPPAPVLPGSDSEEEEEEDEPEEDEPRLLLKRVNKQRHLSSPPQVRR
ncbi:ABC transporter F family member 4-like [Solea solea]|uniref:ABC transporter F family member 4-like n=1 Tax=Solea solea TaxID=90069 RepID=UPI002729C986|nr:ABC transporter F family member 4-like [Solea solea]